MADGSIRVSTKLDNKPAEADLKKLEKECEKTAKEIEKVGEKVKTAFTGGSGMQKFANDCEQAAEKIGDVGRTAQAVFTGMSKGQLNSAFKTANKELGKTEEALAAVEGKIAEIQAETDKMLPQATTDEQAANLIAMEEQQTAPLLAQRDALTAKAAEYRQQMEAITAELNEQAQAEAAQKALKTTGKQAAADAEWFAKIQTQKQYDAALSSTKAKMAAIEQQAARIAQETGKSKDKLLQQDAEYQKLSGRLSLLTSQAKNFGTAGANAGKKTKKEMSKAGKAVNSLGTSLKKGIKKVGKMALAVLGVRAAFSAVRRAANAYLEQNENLKNQISSIWNVAGQALGPFIEVMVQGLSTIIVWVNSLIKALTGVDLVAKANAAALKKQATATKDAAKAAQLAGFDEMNKLQDNTSASSGSSDSAAIFDTSMANIPSFLEKMKEQILNGDWFGAGETLGQALMDGIKNIDWYELGYDIGDTIVSAAQFALGFLLELDPKTIIGSVNSFLGGLFKAIAEGIEELDWQEIGGDILELLLYGLMGTLAVTNPALGIIMFMLTPNSDKLASGLAELAGSVLGALAAALVGAAKKLGEKIKEAWKAIKKHFDKYVDWDDTPENIIKGLWEGIKDAVKNIGEWIKKNIFDPFIKGFKKAFGIASPAKEMKPLGKAIIQGLIGGFGNIWTQAKEKFTEFKTKVSAWFTTQKSNFKTWGSGLISKLGSGIGNIWTKIKGKFTDAKDKISGWATELKEKGKTAGSKYIDGLKNGFDTLKTKLKEPINALIGMIEKALNWIIGKMNKLSWKIPDWVPGIGGNKFGFDLKEVSIPRLARGGATPFLRRFERRIL